MIKGRIYSDGAVKLFHDDKEIDIKKSLMLRKHSPEGFAWGYGGQGPAQTALAILLELVGKQKALKWYQKFKKVTIAQLEQAETFTMEDGDIKKYIDHLEGKI